MRISLLLAALLFGFHAHPVAADAPAGDAAATMNVFDEATLTVPEAFAAGKPASRIVEYEYVAKAGEGDAVQTARVYAMASGGGVEQNIQRWKGQFSDSPADAFKKEDLKLGKWTATIVDHAGTFADSMGGGPFSGGKVIQRTDYGMVGAIIQHPDGRLYFVKMIGPAQVVKANRDAFITMIKSIDR